MKILCGTTYVFDNEPCLGLAEVDRQSPDASGFHRYQVITVIRNDKEVVFEKDLGLSTDFKVDPFYIPGGVREGKGGVICHNVGELVNIAEKLKTIQLWDKKELAQNNNIRLKF